MQKKTLPKEQAAQKLRQYCGYQERSHYEAKQKLWELGVNKMYHDEIIADLIQEDYLNEERFAILFAGGKFRMKEWGRKKIVHALQEKRVSQYNIKNALQQIDYSIYQQKLQQLASEKYALLKDEQYMVRRKKTTDYLLQKGYEHELISAALSTITEKNKFMAQSVAMKKITLLCILFISAIAQAQGDSTNVVQPEQENSYNSTDLLLISLAGLAILLSIYFLFKRARGRR